MLRCTQLHQDMGSSTHIWSRNKQNEKLIFHSFCGRCKYCTENKKKSFLSVSSFYCASLNASTLHNSLLYLSAPDSITILNVTLRGGDVASVKYFPFMQNLEYVPIKFHVLSPLSADRKHVKWRDLIKIALPMTSSNRFLDISGTSLTRVDFPSEIRFPSLRTLLLNSNKIEVSRPSL